MRTFTIFALQIAALLALTANCAFSQAQLKEMSKRLDAKWRFERAIAESIAAAHSIPVRIKGADGSVKEIQRFRHGIPEIFTTYNLTSAKTISTNDVWPGGGYGFTLSGLNDTIGEWDAGSPLTTHQELVGRIITYEGSVDGHSTHVAGTLIATGIVPQAHGMSFQALLYCREYNNDVAEMTSAAAEGLRLSNHSYGIVTGWYQGFFNNDEWGWFGDPTVSDSQDYRFGFYDDEAQEWDNLAYSAPYYLMVKAAGNDRGSGPSPQPVIHFEFNSEGDTITSDAVREINGGSTGYRTVSGSGCAKNDLVVGAIYGNVAGYTGPANVLMTWFSNWGPTDDGRIKPDIVADGVNLYSTYSDSNTSYAYMSGTSMATPSVTGSVGLLLQEQKNLHGNHPLRSSTLRGLVLHTADDAGTPGPDYVFGWGQMNTLHAVQLMQLDSADGPNSHISEYKLLNADTINVTLYSDGVDPLKVTICWNDPPGVSPSLSVDPPTIMLVNDLDLRIIKQSDQSVSMPWVLDPSNPSAAATTGDNVVDNIEQVLIQNPSPGIYTARITHKGTLSGGSQYVSMISSGNLPYYKPILAVSQTSGAYTHNPGSVVQESLMVYNRGDLAMSYSAKVRQPWLIVDTAGQTLQPLDSAYLYFAFNGTLFSQWSTYTDTITITSNDTANPHEKIPVTLSTQGPKILVPSALTIQTDTGTVASYPVIVHNIGTMPLSISVSDTDAPPRPWLSIGSIGGPISAGDSLQFQITVDAPALTPGSYTAGLKISSNDSLTGNVFVQLIIDIISGITVQVSVASLWDLVSVPVNAPFTARTDLFPTSVTDAYTYAGSYVVADSLKNGVGYWLKFSSGQIVPITGLSILIDTIPVTIGWNMIGSITKPVPVNTIGSNAPGMITSDIFGYSNGYESVDTIKPGEGYWIKVNQNGSIILTAYPPAMLTNRIAIVHTPEMPPPPPGHEEQQIAIPKEFTLADAYPDPFNPSTNIVYALPVPVYVSLKVYNLLGEEVTTLAEGQQDAGYKIAKFNASNLPAGIYFYRIRAGAFTATKKMLLIK